jgi:hypothetical protein
VWGAVLAPILSSLRGARYWTSWIVVGAVALSLVAFFAVPALFLKLFGAARSE